MSGRIPSELIDEIRVANDIVDVISERVPVKKAGSNYKALCPFHTEKTPSFNINQERQIYHCFGCGASGNVISFLMEYDKLGFVEAVKELAGRAGITLPERASGRWRDQDEDPCYEANAAARTFFRHAFESNAGAVARDYCAGRGLSDDILRVFEIGYAPPGWDGLLKAAARAGISDGNLKRAGLIVEREGASRPYDRFRDRLIFPLALPGGRIVGFGGRALGEQEPKYLNSPETPVYRKGRYIYGLAQARPSLRTKREAILVEGYMDLVSLYQAGFRNVVASSGTALAIAQGKLLSRYVDKVFVAYDGDSAGIEAATRAAEALVRSGLKVRVVGFPDGQDPDSYLRAEGANALRERLQKAGDFIDFFVDVNAPRSSEDREAAASALISSVVMVDDPVKADLMLEKIADVLSIRRGAVSRAYEARLASQAAARGRRNPRDRKEIPEAEGQIVSACGQAERGLIELLLLGGVMARGVRQEIAPEDFQDPILRRLAEILYPASEGDEPPDVAALIDDLAGSEGARLLAELSATYPENRNGDRLLCDYVRTVRRRQVEEEVRSVESAIRAAEMTDDEAALISLIEQRQELAARLMELT